MMEKETKVPSLLNGIKGRILLDHIFLTRKLLDNIPMTIENKIFKAFYYIIKTYLPPKTLSTMNRWALVQRDIIDFNFIKSILTTLLPGEKFCLHLSKQNSTITINHNTDSTATISVFNVQPRQLTVTQNPELYGLFPVTAIVIPSKIALSGEVADQILNLHSHQTMNYHDAINPKIILEWLIPVLSVYENVNLNNDDSNFSHSSNEKFKIDKNVFMEAINIPSQYVNTESTVPNPFEENEKKNVNILCLKKKVNDCVLFSNNGLWRRSVSWMALKSVFHVMLCEEIGIDLGTYLYKLLMIHFMCILIKEQTKNINLSLDLRKEILSKISRRIGKIENNYKTTIPENINININFYKKVIQNCLQTIEQIVSETENMWSSYIYNVWDKQSNLQFNPERTVKNHTYHTLPSSKNIIENIMYRNDCQKISSNASSIQEYSMKWISTLKDDEKIWILHHKENEMYSMVVNDDIYDKPDIIYQKWKDYISMVSFYNDPLIKSRKYLFSYAATMVIDKITCSLYPLLLKYPPNVDISFLNNILAPLTSSLQLLKKIESYFENRKSKAIYKTIMPLDSPTDCNSITVRMARNSPKMMEELDKILDFDNQNIKNTKDKITKLIEYKSSLIKKMSELKHMYDERYSIDISTPIHYHLKECKLCKLQRKLDNLSSDIYERILPDNKNDQCAIIFELMMPQDYGIWRDCYFYLNELLHRIEYKNYCQISWIDNYKLNKWKTLSYSPRITLYSTTCHRNNSQKLDNYSPDDFIYPCRLDCHISCNNRVISLLSENNSNIIENFQKECAFTLEGKYTPLQWTVTKYDHHQSNVIAEQSNCPSNITLSEFVTFGSLRSGVRLQWRHIYSAIFQRSLSFHTVEVNQLICQALWQACYCSNEVSWVRDSNLFLDNIFILDFCVKLKDYLDIISKNWECLWSLFSVITIATRLLDMVYHDETDKENCIQHLLEILKYCRCLGKNWIKKIEDLLKLKVNDHEEWKRLRLNIGDIGIFCAMSFHVSVNALPLLFQSSDDVVDWIFAIVSIHDNSILINNQPTGFRKQLILEIYRLSFNLHPILTKAIQNDNSIIHKLVQLYYCNGTLKDIEIHSNNTLCISCNLEKQNGISQSIFINILGGLFLVDNTHIGKLNVNITSNKDYKRIFGNTLFEVMSCKDPDGISGFQTKHTFSGSRFLFSTLNYKLRIFEENEDGKYYQLVSHELLNNDLPSIFVNSYSHWLSNNILYFRPVSFTKKKFYDQNMWEYELNCVHWTLKNKIDNSLLIDINSNFALKIYEIFGRIEILKYIHIWYISSSETVKEDYCLISLPRHSLNFKLNLKTFIISSVEISNYNIRISQNINTLIGLPYGLVLENTQNEKSIKTSYLIPHTYNFTVSPNNYHHHISMDLSQFSTPTYFVFHINPLLKRLEAPSNQTAWIYLSYLHGITSNPFPDPFTGITGTEFALSLLQLARNWSCHPYDLPTRKILELLSNLSPKREISQNAEKINWPSINSWCAHDGFVLIVRKLIMDSERLNFLFPKYVNKQQNNDVFLNEKAYYKMKKWISPLGRLELFLGKKKYIPKYAFDNHTRNLSALSIAMVVRDNCLFNFSKTGFQLFQYLQENSDYTLSSLDKNNISSCIGWDSVNMKTHFMDLHKILQDRNNYSKIYRTLLLSYLGFKGNNISPILAILVGINNYKGYPVSIPPYTKYPCLKMLNIGNTINNAAISLTQYCRNNELNIYDNYIYDEKNIIKFNQLKKQYNNNISEATQYFTNIYNYILLLYNEQLLEKLWNTNDNWDTTITINNFLNNNTNNLYKDRSFFNIQNIISDIVTYFNIYNKRITLLYYCLSLTKSLQTVPIVPSNIPLPIKPQFIITYLKPSVPHLLTNKQYIPPEVNKIYYQPNLYYLFPWEVKTTNGLILPDINNFAKAFMNDIQYSYSKYHNNTSYWNNINFNENTEYFENLLEKYKVNIIKKYEELWEILETALSPNEKMTGLGLMWRLKFFLPCLPITVIPFLVEKNNNDLMELIGAIVILWIKRQKVDRCIDYLLTKNKDWFFKEIKNKSYDEWEPSKYTEWMIFELENNISLWPIQTKMANYMMYPVHCKNVVMQLNMGEGKTKVILPLIATKLADSIQLVRIIVLPSLFSTNFEEMIQKLGGFLNRRIYSFPFSRKILLKEYEIQKIYNTLQECKNMKGVIITVPEHILSFRLKYFETSIQQNTTLAADIGNILNYLNMYVRDIIDEADEVLHYNPLIYAIGKQLPPDGCPIRHKVIQAVLISVSKHATALQEKFGSQIVELNFQDPLAVRFPCLRLLESPNINEAFNWLCERITNDFLESSVNGLLLRPLKKNQSDIILNFVLSRSLNQELLNSFNSLDIGDMKSVYLTLRGILAYEILKHGLEKRWRVEYGVDPNGPRRIAVPFRAKDTAVDRNEFSHPDVAVILTQLSYYYSGLKDEQIEQVLDRLWTMKNKASIYNKWVDLIGQDNLDKTIRELQGINRMDPFQTTEVLYPFLRYHMLCIDFYLNTIVYPNELIHFPNKIVATAWDLCPDSRKLPITAFSGTNDTKYLLPHNIQQHDLEELEETNARVCQYILLPENNVYHVFPSQCNVKQILEHLTSNSLKRKPQVLIDAGALILELNNKEVAKHWLKLRSDMSAAIYFDDDDIIKVMDRQQGVMKLQVSPYQYDLSRCVIYIDDIHCRGTDLKIPAGTHAAVTLGKGLTKDKFVQSCMRMRLLGYSHSLSFWASSDVNSQILMQLDVMNHEYITNKQVLEWCFINSIKKITNRLLIWVSHGISYMKLNNVLQRATNDETENILPINHSGILVVGKNCCETDHHTLQEMYGVVQELEYIPDIVKCWTKNLDKNNVLVDKCNIFAPLEKRYAYILEENQERELEQEVEKQCQIIKSPNVVACQEYLSNDLEYVCKTGEIPNNHHFIHLPLSLSSTSLYQNYKSLFHCNAWDKRLLVTPSFKNTINTYCYQQTNDKYLRPVTWIIIVRTKEEDIEAVIAISPYEANKSIYILHECKTKNVSLHIYSPQTRPLNGLLIDQPGSNPIGKPLTVLSTSIVPHPTPTSIRYLFAQIGIFSGTLYLGKEKYEIISNQSIFALFLSLCPKPHSINESNAFSKSKIELDMFVKPQHVCYVSGEKEKENSILSFDKSPVEMIVKLYHLRNLDEELELSHIGSILLLGVFPCKEDVEKYLTVIE